jgi:hypothetical protein
VHVDETGVDTYIYREYERSLRGEKVQGKISRKKYKRVSIVAGKYNGQMIGPLQYTGTMDSKLFEYWFATILLACLLFGSCIVMGNASLHRIKRAFKISESRWMHPHFSAALFA